MDKLLFNPWIPEDFHSASNKFGKLLLIGESHIANETTKMNKNFTINVIEEVLDENRCRDYRHFTFLGNLISPNDRATTFKHCAFANIIQDVFPGPGIPPNKNQIATIIPAFWELLNVVKPEKIIITSARTWEKWMPDNDVRSAHIDNLKIDGRYSSIWRYKYNGGTCEAIGINHPRSRNFYSWRQLVTEFINRK